AAGVRHRPPSGQRRLDRRQAEAARTRAGRHGHRCDHRQRKAVAWPHRGHRPRRAVTAAFPPLWERLQPRAFDLSCSAPKIKSSRLKPLPREPTQEHAMTASPAPNFRQSELDKFAALANRWWDPRGPQKALHALNPVRLGYVADRIGLQGAKVLDVGCGGGLLSEALARAGADVTAIDLAADLVKVARLHGLESGVKVDYRVQAVEELAAEQPGGFDAV